MDSGAVYSLMPLSSEEPASGPSRFPAGAGQMLKLSAWVGVLPGVFKAAVAFLLLGTDFLVYHALLVDLANM